MPHAFASTSLMTSTWGIAKRRASSRASTAQGRFVSVTRPSFGGPATPMHATSTLAGCSQRNRSTMSSRLVWLGLVKVFAATMRGRSPSASSAASRVWVPPTSMARIIVALLGNGDRFPEEREAVDEEPETDPGHHQELGPDGAEPAAAVDDHLREADEVPRRQEVRHVLEPLRLAFDRRAPSGEEHQDDDHQDDQERELRHRSRDRPEKDAERGREKQVQH